MTIPGESAGLHGATCDCGKVLQLRIQRSAAGSYLGYRCPFCGPYRRVSGYYPTDLAAYDDLLRVWHGLDIENARSA